MLTVIPVKDGLFYKNNMKHVLLIITVFVLQSCANTKVNSKNTEVKIYRTYQQSGYTFFNGLKDNDTIVLVADTKFINNCAGVKNIIDVKNLRQVSFLKTDKDTLCFVYSIRDINNTVSITSGRNSPGASKSPCINTYSSYPYFIDSCEVFKK